MISDADLDGILDEAWRLLERGKAKAAVRLLERTLAGTSMNEAQEADTRHALGTAYAEMNARPAMVREWLRVRALDERADAGASLLTIGRFEREAERALAELPAPLLAGLGNVAVVIDDRPSVEMVRDGVDPRLLGMFSGLPLPEQSALGGGGVPQVIQLFRRNLEAEVATAEELVEEIRITVIHETAHYFGLDDDDLDRLGLG